MSTAKLPDKLTVRCCGCNGEVTFQHPTDDPKDCPVFFHTMPYCARFAKTNTADDVVQYLRDCGNAQRN